MDNPTFSTQDETTTPQRLSVTDLPAELVADTAPDPDPERDTSRTHLSRRLHARLAPQDSDVSVMSDSTCGSNGSNGAADPVNQEVPPNYHEVVAQQVSLDTPNCYL